MGISPAVARLLGCRFRRSDRIHWTSRDLGDDLSAGLLKIPIVYLCAVIWWAIKAEPKPEAPAALVSAETPDPGGPRWPRHWEPPWDAGAVHLAGRSGGRPPVAQHGSSDRR